MGSQTAIMICAVIGGIIASIVIGVIVGSFSYLHYYQMGFQRQSSTGYIYTDKVFLAGRHFIGPTLNFKSFPASALFVSLYRTSVFTTNKLPVEIDVTFQYFLRPEQLKWLHKGHQLDYDTVIRKRAVSALKDHAMQFNTDQFIKNRTIVEQTLFKAVRERLGGVCCQRNCNAFKSPGCTKGCVAYATCPKTSSGIFVDVRYFQMGNLYLPSKLAGKYLKTLTVKEDKETEVQKQKEAVVLKQMDEEMKEIGNRVNEVLSNATAKSELTQTKVKAETKRIIEEAHSAGLKLLLTKLGLTKPQQRLSYHYLNALQASAKAHFAVDFTQLMMVGKQ